MNDLIHAVSMFQESDVELDYEDDVLDNNYNSDCISVCDSDSDEN